MPVSRKGTERRFGKRLNISLPITLLDHKAKSKNVSPGGIYFEVSTNDADKYSPGKTIKIEITTGTYTHKISGQMIKVTGTGVITRIDKLSSKLACSIEEARRRGEKLGVALKFNKRPELFVEE